MRCPESWQGWSHLTATGPLVAPVTLPHQGMRLPRDGQGFTFPEAGTQWLFC